MRQDTRPFDARLAKEPSCSHLRRWASPCPRSLNRLGLWRSRQVLPKLRKTRSPFRLLTPASSPAAGAPVAKIEVPAGTHIPLVLHNAISTRSARAGDPVYLETLFPVMIDGRVVYLLPDPTSVAKSLNRSALAA